MLKFGIDRAVVISRIQKGVFLAIKGCCRSKGYVDQRAMSINDTTDGSYWFPVSASGNFKEERTSIFNHISLSKKKLELH